MIFFSKIKLCRSSVIVLLVLSLMVMEVNGRRFESQLLAVGLFIIVIIYIEMFRISIGVVTIISVVVVIIIVDVAIDFSIFFDTFGFGLVEGVIIVAVVNVIVL